MQALLGVQDVLLLSEPFLAYLNLFASTSGGSITLLGPCTQSGSFYFLRCSSADAVIAPFAGILNKHDGRKS